MAKNDSVNTQETFVPEGQFIYSQTDLKGIITEANTLFAKISDYPQDEMVGRPHNLVRHPDMPKQAFADMWRDLKAGMPWRAIVKNRRKDGGFYWVVANASPVHANGHITGYQSVRTAPTRDQIKAAEEVYRRIQNGDKSISVKHGQAVPVHSALRDSIDTFEHKIVLPSLATLFSTVLGAATIFFGHENHWLQYIAGAAFAFSAIQACYMLFLFLPKLLRDVNTIDAFLDDILHTGNLTRELTLSRSDTIGELGRKFLLTIAWFRTSLMCINNTIETVQEITREVVSSVHEIKQAANTQSDATNSVAAAIEEMSLSILEIAERLNDTEGAVNRTGDKATEGSQLSVRATVEIQNLASAIRKVSEEVEALSASSTQVGEIAGAIRAIADQTNLLALNASIEAARAGEAGRGFSVVANEVRSLADRTMKATESIDSLIGKIKSDSDRAIRGIQIGSGQVETTVNLVHEAESSLNQINKMMTEAVQMVSGIAVASTEQTAAVQDIGVNIASVSTMTSSNLDVANRTSGLIDALGPKVARAKAAVAQFGM